MKQIQKKTIASRNTIELAGIWWVNTVWGGNNAFHLIHGECLRKQNMFRWIKLCNTAKIISEWPNILDQLSAVFYETNYSDWDFIPWCGKDFGLAWLPHSRYPRTHCLWIQTCYFPFYSARLKRAPKQGPQRKSHRQRRESAFKVMLIKYSMNVLLSSSRLLLLIYSRKGWMKFRRLVCSGL